MNSKRGSALIMCYMVIAILFASATPFFVSSGNEAHLALRGQNSARAFWTAEAGLQQGLYALNNSNWTGWTTLDASTKTIGPSTLGGAGQYITTISGLGSNTVTIDSFGFSPSQTASNFAQRTVRGVYASSPLFGQAVYGTTNVSLSGNAYTNSYDSSQGAYGGENIGSNGGAGTAGNTVGTVSLSGNAVINGDVGTGPNGTVTTEGNSYVAGSITHNNTTALSAVTVPTNLTTLVSGGGVSVSGNNNQEISAGDYRFNSISVSGNAALTLNGNVNIYITNSSSLSVSGNGRLIIAGTARIYVDGSCGISGNGIVNNTQIPANFILYGTPSSSNVSFTGNANFYGAVYAPSASVGVSGNGGTFGALVGNSVTLSGNGGAHYDEALSNIAGSGYTFQSWEEV